MSRNLVAEFIKSNGLVQLSDKWKERDRTQVFILDDCLKKGDESFRY